MATTVELGVGEIGRHALELTGSERDYDELLALVGRSGKGTLQLLRSCAWRRPGVRRTATWVSRRRPNRPFGSTDVAPS